MQDLVEAVLEAAAHRLVAESQPGLEDALEVIDARPAVEADEVEVDPVGALQVGGGIEVGHEPFDGDAAVAGDQHQARRGLVVGFVAQVLQPG